MSYSATPENESQVNLSDSLNQYSFPCLITQLLMEFLHDGRKRGIKCHFTKLGRIPSFILAWTLLGEALGMCLAEKGDENQCVFDRSRFSVGRLCSHSRSHPGIAIC